MILKLKEKKKLMKKLSEGQIKYIEDSLSTIATTKIRKVSKIIEPSVIVDIVQKKYKVRITVRTRKKEYVMPRAVTSFFLHKYTLMTLEQISDYVGVRHHTTVMHHVKKINDLIDVYPEIEYELKKIDVQIQNYYDNLYSKIDTDASNSIQTL